MDFSQLEYWKEYGAVFDEKKKRMEVRLSSDHGDGGSIVAYFPSDSLQVFIYDIHTKHIPDLGMDHRGDGRYLRVNICKSGRCEFTSSKGGNAYLSEEEAAMEYGLTNDGSFRFDTGNYVGVQIIMQIDSVITEIPMFDMFKKAIKGMNLPESEIKNSSVYFVDISSNTNRTLCELVEYSKDGADSSLIVIKVSEIGYNLGCDLFDSKSKLRTFATNAQTQIAQDIYNTLTNEYSEKITADMFAKKYGMSETTVKGYFKYVYGYGYKEYQMKVRMEKAAELLTTTDYSIGEISQRVGYKSQPKFGEAFKNYFGLTPLAYRHNEKLKRNTSHT